MAGGISKSLTWNGKAVKARMKAAQREGVNRTMAGAVRHARDNHNWDNQTGILEGAINIITFAYENEKGVTGVWGVQDVAYARIRELGGTITPKKAKFLAIPISDAARRAGSPRQMANLAYVQSVKGQPMLVDADSGDVHYLLRKRVVVHADPYLRPAADAIYPQLTENIRKAWEKHKPTQGGGSREGGEDA
ncbi:MAG: phage morphogenesis protein [Pseudomonadota bacterium]|nr:phage morphogenesis protein [Pseudomonadota bacterium]